jgi:glycosyltransferase involved in cell wall biosynthesis
MKAAAKAVAGASDVPRRRIAIVLPDMKGGGVEKMSVVLAGEFLERGFSVDFVLGRASGEQLANIPTEAGILELGASRLLGMLRPLVRYLTVRRPDAVLASMWPLTCIASVAVKLARIRARIVVCDHNMLSRAYARRGPLHRLMMRATLAATYPLADARVTVSSGIAKDIRRLAGIAERNFSVIPNPVPPQVPAAAADAHDPWGQARGARIISVGSFKPQKNHALLIRAFAEVAKQREATLLLLGEGALRPELEQLVRALGLEGSVLMPGFAADPAPYFATADLFVLSSDYEGFGIVIVEALAAGLPVVSTDCPSGPSDILEGGRHGELVPCGDSAALAAAILRALDGEHHPEALRARADAFSPAVAAEAYLRLLFPAWESSGAEHRRESNDAGAGG